MMVADSSTVILLARIELLRSVAERHPIQVTEEVFAECTVKKALDSRLIQALKEAGKIAIEPLTEEDQVLLKKLRADFKLGRGEASALVLAHRQGLPLATDDRLAMKVAKLLDIDFVTALHFLIEAYESSQIGREIALEKLDNLEKIGRYSERILADARRRLELTRSGGA